MSCAAKDVPFTDNYHTHCLLTTLQHSLLPVLLAYHHMDNRSPTPQIIRTAVKLSIPFIVYQKALFNYHLVDSNPFVCLKLASTVMRF